MRFAPEYVTYVRNESFEDAKELFLSPLMAIHYAHLAMLAAQNIVSAEAARALRVALDSVSQAEVRGATYDGTCEDLGRFVQDLLLWCTAEFGYVQFDDAFVQSSSIMPQKRNPVAIEHARAISSKALGQAQAASQAELEADLAWSKDAIAGLAAAERRLAERSARL